MIHALKIILLFVYWIFYWAFLLVGVEFAFADRWGIAIGLVIFHEIMRDAKGKFVDWLERI